MQSFAGVHKTHQSDVEAVFEVVVPHFKSLLSWLKLEDHAIEGEFLCALLGDEFHASSKLLNNN